MREAGLLHLREEVQVAKNPRRGRDQRLAYVRPREELLLEDHALDSGFRQIRSHASAGGAAADDADVEIHVWRNREEETAIRQEPVTKTSSGEGES
jgi:hypothetical protein